MPGCRFFAVKSTWPVCRYFIVKCNTEENVRLSAEHGVWATSRSNERKLNEAFASTEHVLLIFSVNESQHFQVGVPLFPLRACNTGDRLLFPQVQCRFGDKVPNVFSQS